MVLIQGLNICFFKNTEHATPSSIAFENQEAQMHQLSPSLRPGKPNSGRGVLKSFPTFFDQVKKSLLTLAHTVCKNRDHFYLYCNTHLLTNLLMDR